MKPPRLGRLVACTLVALLWACDEGGTEEAEPADAQLTADAGEGEGEGEGEVPQGWSPMAEIDGGPIQEIAVLALNGEIYILGGFDSRALIVATGRAYDPRTDTWRSIADLPVRMHHANAVAAEGKIYIVGFLANGFQADARGFIYDPVEDAWSEGPRMPGSTGRGASGTVLIDRRIYFAGGLAGGGAVDLFSAYDLDSEAWIELPPVPTPRDHMAVGAIDGKLVIASGRGGPIESVTPRVDIYDPVANSWSEGAPMPTPRGGTAGAVLEGKLYVFGGEGNRDEASGVFAEVEAYDLAEDSWSSLESMPTPRHGMGAATLDGVIYVPGGATVQAFGAVDAAERYRP